MTIVLYTGVFIAGALIDFALLQLYYIKTNAQNREAFMGVMFNIWAFMVLSPFAIVRYSLGHHLLVYFEGGMLVGFLVASIAMQILLSLEMKQSIREVRPA